ADHALDGLRHLDARLEPVTAKVEHIELGQLILPVEQLNDGCCDVRQVGPGVARGWTPRIADGAHRLARLDEALGKPAVARAGPEITSGPDNQATPPLAAGGLQPLLHFDADLAFACHRILR